MRVRYNGACLALRISILTRPVRRRVLSQLLVPVKHDIPLVVHGPLDHQRHAIPRIIREPLLMILPFALMLLPLMLVHRLPIRRVGDHPLPRTRRLARRRQRLPRRPVVVHRPHSEARASE
jgi:hypothetical protein